MSIKSSLIQSSIDPNKNFWQVSILVPKSASMTVEYFFIESGAVGSYEILYQEGITNNLQEDNTTLVFFFEENFPLKAFIAMSLPVLKLENSEYEIELINYAKFLSSLVDTFKTFLITENMQIVPPWDYEASEYRKDVPFLILNPSFAFGTGKHQTTKLMVEFIEKNVKGKECVIDVGCGSGILGIAALKQGASTVIGIDVENLSVENANDNYTRNSMENNIEGRAKFLQGGFEQAVTQIKGEGNGDTNSGNCKNPDIFLSNILPATFKQNKKHLEVLLKSSNVWALSGVNSESRNDFFAWLKTITKDEIHETELDDWHLFSNV